MTVRGAVQGVGFRPFVHRLATGLGLVGWIHNSCRGVALEVEGPRKEVESFLIRLEAEKPARSFIQSLDTSWLDPVGHHTFEIRPSEAGGARTALVLPDMAACPDCLREIFDPLDRRYLYPFANCTHCGPRFSIIESLPYDRGNTTMKQFPLCRPCHEEFDNPLDRRFHAQPNACPARGPQLELWDSSGKRLRRSHATLLAAARQIRQGGIVALKGLGGFHLITAALDDAAVRRLREWKHRRKSLLRSCFRRCRPPAWNAKFRGWKKGRCVRLRDLTRGGLASALNEIAQAARLRILIEEKLIPVRNDVHAACAVLGLDPLLVVCEGRFVALVALQTVTGSSRVLDMPSGEQLPRIC